MDEAAMPMARMAVPRLAPVACRHDQHGEQQRREGDENVERRRQHIIDGAGGEGGQQSHGDANGRGDGYGTDADSECDAGTDHDFSEQIAAETIGAGPMGERWGREAPAGHRRWIIRRPQERQQPDDDMKSEQRCADQKGRRQAPGRWRGEGGRCIGHGRAPLVPRRRGSTRRCTRSAAKPTRSTNSVEMNNTP